MPSTKASRRAGRLAKVSTARSYLVVGDAEAAAQRKAQAKPKKKTKKRAPRQRAAQPAVKPRSAVPARPKPPPAPDARATPDDWRAAFRALMHEFDDELLEEFIEVTDELAQRATDGRRRYVFTVMRSVMRGDLSGRGGTSLSQRRATSK